MKRVPFTDEMQEKLNYWQDKTGWGTRALYRNQRAPIRLSFRAELAERWLPGLVPEKC